MCIRHELSPAVQTSAPVSRTRRILSESIAAEVSAFLTAKVPPNPQHSSASESSTRSMPRTFRNAQRRITDFEHPMSGGRVVVRGADSSADVDDDELSDQNSESETRGQLLDCSARLPPARSAAMG